MTLNLIAGSPFVLDMLARWATEQGLTVVSQGGLVVKVTGDPTTVEQALRIQFHMLPDGGWHTSDTPTLPHGAVAVVGLTTRGTLESHVKIIDNPMPTLASPGNDGLTPEQIAIAYGVAGSFDGTGQTIAIAEWGGGFNQSDIDDFCATQNLPPCTPEWRAVGALAENDPSGGAAVETLLDICWAHAMAPGATIKVYNASAGGGGGWSPLVIDVLNDILTDPTLPAVLSISYGCAEEDLHPQDLTGWNTLIAALTAKGVTVLASSGDSGAYGKHAVLQPQIPRVSAPASCPAAVGVGGTAVYLNGLAFEAEWGWSNDLNQGAGGGGYSSVFARPAYQDGLSPQPTQRGVPDIAGPASTTTYAYLRQNGQLLMIGGTSWATPVVAGILTRIVQERAAHGLPPLGDILPVLYQDGATLCRDITVGNNSCYAVPGFDCAPGWDAVTGWGSPQYPAWQQRFVTDALQPATSQPTKTAPTKSTPAPTTAHPASLTVAALDAAPNGHYGASLIPLQVDARYIAFMSHQMGSDGGALFMLAHRPYEYFVGAMQAAHRLWAAGVRG